jgi:dethiobiotin synthetase/adenosylmethionine--8-amino-7-oxononanoate aminotransferase
LDVPALLVGDARLGGISCSLCAWEALVRRGFDVRSVVFVGDDAALGNADAVRAVTGLGDGVLATVAPPPLPEPLDGWLAETAECFDAVCASVL